MNKNFIIRFQTEDGVWQIRDLKIGEITIGRGSDCEVVVDSEEVSRKQFRIKWDGKVISIMDLGSSNGTIVDDVLLVPYSNYPLKPGQLINFSGLTMVALVKQNSGTPKGQVEEEKPKTEYHLYYYRELNLIDRIKIPQGDTTIGRGDDCGIQIDTKEVSRHHARIELVDNKLWLVDLGSTNGTLIDGALIPKQTRVPIGVNQVINIGEYSFKFDLHPVKPRKSELPGSKTSPVAKLITPTQMFSPDMLVSGSQIVGSKTMISSEEVGEQVPVRSLNLTNMEKIAIGRSDENNVMLNHPLVSRYHAVLEKMGTRFRLRDLRSTNGVFVNGEKVDNDVFLKDWDEIRIGPYTFVLSGQNLQAQEVTGLRLEARDINQRVSSQLNLLKNISLSIKPLEFIAIVGMSGSGKTTLLNALSGYRPASHGKVFINDIDLYDHYDLYRNDIGYVPQKDIVHAELTPETALEFTARLRMPPDTTPEERSQVVSGVLEDLDLIERKAVPISKLSGGQLKRVSIGVELLTKPRLFFLDEPTSGLDPGTEYDMMKLLRKLADQGRTVMLITHATKNVMICDKVIFLARGGNLAFFGPPEDALTYFNKFRNERERREKEMEFDDIYRILNDESRGSPAEWGKRYLQSPHYAASFEDPQSIADRSDNLSRMPGPAQHRRKQTGARVSSFRQFVILSARNIKILAQDKVSLGLMLALAPAIGLMDFIWGPDLFDPVKGDSAKILTMWFMLALITVLVGALSSVREIVKEVDIYKRERAVNLKILPYILSKVWVGIVLAIYQAGMFLLFKLLFVNLDLPSSAGYLSLYITLFLGTLVGYLIGLTISASAPNQNSAMMLIIVVLVPQFLFAGALLPLDLIPGGKTISLFMPTRWAFESFVRVTGMGEQLTSDPCWSSFPKYDRNHLPDELKVDCPCMGESIFTSCSDFPGILSADFFDENSRLALSLAQPVEPPQPTAYPYPTAYPSPTALFTPTPKPSLTPMPTPQNPADLPAYMDDQRDQGKEYYDLILDQFEVYRLESQDQGEEYSIIRSEQGDQYAERRQDQGDEYASLMRNYGDERAEWQENREKAISSAEGMLGSIYDNYAQTFQGTVMARWTALSIICLTLIGIVLFFQKRKDVV